MGKRKKGGKGKKRQTPMTRRDPDAKRERRAERGAAGAESPDDDADEGEAARDDEERDDEERDEGVAAASTRQADSDVASNASMEQADPDERVPHPEGAAWGLPLLKLEQKWTWLETRLLFVALLTLTLVLCFWIVMRGLKEPIEAEAVAGTVFRALAGAAILGGLARVATRGRLEEKQRNWATVAAVVLGLVTAKAWRGVGISYASAWLDWLQEGSALTLMGGLQGVSTRLTMVVALIGASLASASAAHINIDVITRVIPAHIRKLVHVLGGIATVVVCLATSWGLFDHIAVASYHIQRDLTPGQKIEKVGDELGHMFFVWRKQVGLDLGALPVVIGGGRWNREDRMNGREWNELLASGGFVERYGEEKVALIRAPEAELDQPWPPFMVVPGAEARGMLVNGMDLLFPFGFFMIALRYLLRVLLVLAGHIRVDIEGGGNEPSGSPRAKREASDTPDEGAGDADRAAEEVA